MIPAARRALPPGGPPVSGCGGRWLCSHWGPPSHPVGSGRAEGKPEWWVTLRGPGPSAACPALVSVPWRNRSGRRVATRLAGLTAALRTGPRPSPHRVAALLGPRCLLGGGRGCWTWAEADQKGKWTATAAQRQPRHLPWPDWDSPHLKGDAPRRPPPPPTSGQVYLGPRLPRAGSLLGSFLLTVAGSGEAVLCKGRGGDCG